MTNNLTNLAPINRTPTRYQSSKNQLEITKFFPSSPNNNNTFQRQQLPTPIPNDLIRISLLNTGSLQFPCPLKLQECIMAMQSNNISILCLVETGLNSLNFKNSKLIKETLLLFWKHRSAMFNSVPENPTPIHQYIGSGILCRPSITPRICGKTKDPLGRWCITQIRGKNGTSSIFSVYTPTQQSIENFRVNTYAMQLYRGAFKNREIPISPRKSLWSDLGGKYKNYNYYNIILLSE